LVVTAQLTVVVAAVGALPATAVLIVNEGEPVTEIWLIAFTWNVTVCVAVCAAAMLALPVAKAAVSAMSLSDFM
jgi:hypothetical protein